MSCAIEYKNCPRCSVPFLCRAGSISACQCSTVELGRPERNYIQERFQDCLCVRCLHDLKSEYAQTLKK